MILRAYADPADAEHGKSSGRARGIGSLERLGYLVFWLAGVVWVGLAWNGRFSDAFVSMAVWTAFVLLFSDE